MMISELTSIFKCDPGCVCDRGFALSNGKCISTLECENPCRGQSEKFNSCGGCDKLCSDPDRPCPEIGFRNFKARKILNFMPTHLSFISHLCFALKMKFDA